MDTSVPLVTPSAAYPAPSAEDLKQLERVGQAFALDGDREDLPLDPSKVSARTMRPGSRLGRFVDVGATTGGVGEIEAVSDPARTGTRGERGAGGLRRALLGPPLNSTALQQERMSKKVALPVLSSDALSSVAYGPQAMLVVLVVAGSKGLEAALPIAAAIVVLIIAVSVSYRQTIRAYPHGGGSYIVASDNLGHLPGLAAAAGLMCDYILTVAVSVSSGMAAISSAIPNVGDAVVPIGVAVIAILLYVNLRGVRQAGKVFSAPTYAFIAAMLVLIAVGLIDAAGDGFAARTPDVTATEGVTVLLVLRAFGSGATAMTGIEAISDGVPVFKPVEWRNARTTLTWMAGLLVTLFVGTTLLAHFQGLVPSGSETVLSQLGHSAFGHGPLYAFLQAATALILLLAANTAFNDFPRLLFFLARDAFAPKAFLRMGDRLAFSNGIVALAVVAGILYVAFDGNTDKLIPLYAVGVFLAFTLSQTAMVVRWRRRRESGWRHAMAANALGALLSLIVLLVEAGTKFTEGAWLVVVLVPLIMGSALLIRRHYRDVRRATALAKFEVPWSVPGTPAHDGAGLVVVPIEHLDGSALRALAYGVELGQPVLAVHLVPDQSAEEHFLEAWKALGEPVRLEIVRSPYRAIVAPLGQYLLALHAERPDLVLTVVLPEIVPRSVFARPLHGRVTERLRRVLQREPNIVLTSVPFAV
ncbi:MAG TPA: APC family permease [Solirubrobacteraceae bacterium]|jgi:amino acid transporter|nr:APC family permease [Solirubrobacteraceae bacterium]